MKTIFKLSLLVLVAQFATSCNLIEQNTPEDVSIEEDFTPVEINNIYRISLPDYMNKATDLNEEASLQYQNIFKETYMVILDEPKDELISLFQELGEYDDSLSVAENYRDIQLSFITEDIDLSFQSEPETVNINGLDAEMVALDGKIEGVPYEISYFLTFIEGKTNVYMIMAWTLKNRKGKYEETFDKTVKSFELIHDPKEVTSKREEL